MIFTFIDLDVSLFMTNYRLKCHMISIIENIYPLFSHLGIRERAKLPAILLVAIE